MSEVYSITESSEYTQGDLNNAAAYYGSQGVFILGGKKEMKSDLLLIKCKDSGLNWRY